MRAAFFGLSVVAVVVGIGLLGHEFPAVTLWSVAIRVFIGMFAVVMVADYLIRRWRLRVWVSTTGRIETCGELGMPDEGSQHYGCTYLFSVDGARQAGEVRFFGKPNRLEEMRSALVGQQATIRYDPRDCTKSIIEETLINGWKVH